METQLRQRIERLLRGGEDPVAVTPGSTGGGRARASDTVRFQMWCSVTGKGFTVVAVREGVDTLRMLRNEVAGGAGAGTGNGRDEKPASLGSFRIEAGEWPGCPHCVTTDNSRNAVGLLWVCDRWGCGHPVHCTGSREGRFRCACGIVEERTFVRVETMPVRGSARGPTELGQRASRAALAAPAGDSLAPPSARLAFRK